MNVAEIIVNFEEIKKINSYIFGHNSLAYDYCKLRENEESCENDGRFTNFGAGQWDSVLKRPDLTLLDFAKKIKTTVLRFPGGCGTHHYDWKEAIGPIEERPMYKFGIDEFMELCKAIGAKPIITLSYFTGTNQDLADLVEYLNAPLGTNPNEGTAWAEIRNENGHLEPYNVKWFEFGNEVWHGDHINISHVNPWEYAERYLQCKQLIKNVDSEALLGVVAARGEYCLNRWSKTVVSILKNNIDFLIIHVYEPHYRPEDGEIPAEELFKITLAAPDQIKDNLERIKKELKNLTGKEIPIAITEFNGHFTNQDPVPYRHCLGNALFVADLLRVFITIDIPILCANYWQFSNSYWGLVYNPDYMDRKGKYYKRPNYYVFDLYANHFGNILLKTDVRSSGYTQPGFKKVKPSTQKLTEIETTFENYPITIAKISPQDWEIKKIDCVHIIKNKEYIELIFNCQENINFFHVNFPIQLEPKHLYRLKGKIKAENLRASGSGVRLSVQDLRGWKETHWSYFTIPVDETTDWIPVAVDFVPLPDSEGIRVFVRRIEGKGPIYGVAKVKDVEIEDLGPAPQYGPTPYISAIASTNGKRDRIYIMVINKNLNEPMKTRIKINGFSFNPIIHAWVLNGSSIDATNEDCQENVKIHYKRVKVNVKDNSFSFTFEPHSVTALEIFKREKRIPIIHLKPKVKIISSLKTKARIILKKLFGNIRISKI